MFGACVVLQALAVPRLTALRAVRNPNWILSGYVLMALAVMAAGAALRPATTVGVVALLATGWIVNVSALQYGVRRSIA
jgi:hypothetical protein